jgi:hypothetical protein
MSKYIVNPPTTENTDSRFVLGADTSASLDVNLAKTTVGIPTWAIGLAAVGLWWKLAKKK